MAICYCDKQHNHEATTEELEAMDSLQRQVADRAKTLSEPRLPTGRDYGPEVIVRYEPRVLDDVLICVGCKESIGLLGDQTADSIIRVVLDLRAEHAKTCAANQARRPDNLHVGSIKTRS